MPGRTSAGEPFTAAVLHVLKISGLLYLAGDAITRPVKQSSARWQVMGVIDRDPRTVAEIARLLGMARQSIQRIADVLVAEEIAVYKDNPAHRRGKPFILPEHPGKVSSGGQGWAPRRAESGVGPVWGKGVQVVEQQWSP